MTLPSLAPVQWVVRQPGETPLTPGDWATLSQLVGSKGTSLWRMRQAGVQVPPFFVITTVACRHHWERQGEWDPALDDAVKEGLTWLEQAAGCQLGNPRTPLLLAVRSGAPVSMPGTMATLLNCGLTCSFVQDRDTEFFWKAFSKQLSGLSPNCSAGTSCPSVIDVRERCLRQLSEWERSMGSPFPDDPWQVVRLAIRRVFDSWLSPAAQAYRQLHQIDSQLGTAVIVQHMVPAEISGVLFTRDPLTADSETFVIEAIAGLGDELVGGTATPVRYHASATGKLLDTSVAALPQTVHCQLAEQNLAGLCAGSELLRREWGTDVDIEWSVAGGNIFFLQARPIPSTPHIARVSLLQRRTIEELSQASIGRQQIWVKHNLADTLTFPTPLTWSVLVYTLSVNGGFGDLYRRLGYSPSETVQQEGFLRLIAGRIYANCSALCELFCAGYPLTYHAVELREDPTRLELGPRHFDPKTADPWLLFQLPRVALTLLRARWRQRQLLPKAANEFDEVTVPAVVAAVEKFKRQDLTSLDTPGLLNALQQRCEALRRFSGRLLIPGTLGTASFGKLRFQLVSLLGESEGDRIARELLQQVDDPLLARQESLLRAVNQSTESQQRYLQEFGHRAAGEMELANPRWEEVPNDLLALSNSTGVVQRKDSAVSPSTCEELLIAALQRAGIGSLVGPLLRQLRAMQKLLPYRELGRHYFMDVYCQVRSVVKTLATRLDLGRSIYFLTLDEILNFEPLEAVRVLTAGREQDWRIWKTIDVPAVIEADRVSEMFHAESPAPMTQHQWQGTPLSTGVARGRIAHAPTALPQSETVSIVIVAATLDPGMLPLLSRAAGVIVEHGGILSHGAVLARQLGIPAIMLNSAQSILPSGSHVHMDGSTGTISLLESLA